MPPKVMARGFVSDLRARSVDVTTLTKRINVRKELVCDRRRYLLAPAITARFSSELMTRPEL